MTMRRTAYCYFGQFSESINEAEKDSLLISIVPPLAGERWCHKAPKGAVNCWLVVF
jgi:hypothetical protein